MNRTITRRTVAASSLLALLNLAGIGAAHADTPTPWLFGDWNGERTKLQNEGIDFTFGYASEAAHNFSGGDRHITRYTDQFTIGGKFDLGKLWGWNGATFQMIVTERHGKNIDADANLGVYQQIQEIYGRGQTWWLTMLAYDQKLFDGKLEFKLGRLPVGEDFASFSCDFENLTFCGAPPGNIAGSYWANWPVSQWAAWVKWQINPEAYFKLGAYQVNPNYLDQQWESDNAWKPNFPGGTTGALLPFEFGWTPTFNGLAGKYVLGGWYTNAAADDLYYNTNHLPLAIYGGNALQHKSQTGGYLITQQQVTGNDGKGLTVFANATLANEEVTAEDRQFAIGGEYKGIFNRPYDFAGLAFGATHGSKRYAAYESLYNAYNTDPATMMPIQDGYEYVTEVFYNWAIVPGLNLRPNLQYVVHPGGTSDYKNVFVLGLKTVISF